MTTDTGTARGRPAPALPGQTVVAIGGSAIRLPLEVARNAVGRVRHDIDGGQQLLPA